MKNNKTKIFLVLSSVLLSVNLYAKEDAKTEDLGVDMKDPLSFSKVEMYVSEDKQANKIFSKYHKEYLKYTQDTNKDMDRHVLNIKKQITKEIEKTQKFIDEDQKLFDENCKKELKQAEIKQCEEIDKSLYQMKEGVQKMNFDIKNEVAEIENARLNILSKTYINYKNLVGKLKVDVENNKNSK